MNDVVRSIATTGSSATPPRRQRTEQALSLRDTRRGASSDREFLAPVLEILETPASPVRVAFLWIICALVVVGLGLAYFGRIDIIASAQGKFQPTGRVKVIEPVETGRVVAVHAANGAPVKAGDVLVELDRSAAEADARAASAALKSAEAESLRRRAALAAAGARAFSPPPVDRVARRHGRQSPRARGGRAGGGPRPAFRDHRFVRRPEGAEVRRARHAGANHRDPKEPGCDAAGAGRHARRAGRVAVRREVRRHRRDRDPAISADPARHPRGRTRLGDDGARRHRARLGEGGSVVPVGSGAEARRFRAAGRGEPPASRQGRGHGRHPHAQGADRRPRPVVDHHQRRPGRRQRAGDHADRPARLAAGDRSLCARTRTSASCASGRRR